MLKPLASFIALLYPISKHDVGTKSNYPDVPLSIDIPEGCSVQHVQIVALL